MIRPGILVALIALVAYIPLHEISHLAVARYVVGCSGAYIEWFPPPDSGAFVRVIVPCAVTPTQQMLIIAAPVFLALVLVFAAITFPPLKANMVGRVFVQTVAIAAAFYVVFALATGNPLTVAYVP